MVGIIKRNDDGRERLKFWNEVWLLVPSVEFVFLLIFVAQVNPINDSRVNVIKSLTLLLSPFYQDCNSLACLKRSRQRETVINSNTCWPHFQKKSQFRMWRILWQRFPSTIANSYDQPRRYLIHEIPCREKRCSTATESSRCVNSAIKLCFYDLTYVLSDLSSVACT